ncbi:MAG: hypothetical protein F6K09_10290 [Merismopedia sp. SIO2A8]|nr:hypothetical protein [Symploca sp. SIO2B6]NET49093.1 hypothetical protein [Merismopedia sp. SIO2A8]
MPTENPKVSSYVPLAIKNRLTKFREQRNVSESQAVIIILAEYFGMEQEVRKVSEGTEVGGVTLAQMQATEQKLSDLANVVEERFERLGGLLKELSRVLMMSTKLLPEETRRDAKKIFSSLPDSLLSSRDESIANNLVIADKSKLPSTLDDSLPNVGNISEQSIGSSKSEPPDSNETNGGNIPNTLLTELPAKEVVEPSESKSILQTELLLDPSTDSSFQAIPNKLMAVRFGYGHPQSLNNKKNSVTEGEFIEWSRTKDPDGIGWRYQGKGKGRRKGNGYVPADSLTKEQQKNLKAWLEENGGSI